MFTAVKGNHATWDLKDCSLRGWKNIIKQQVYKYGRFWNGTSYQLSCLGLYKAGYK